MTPFRFVRRPRRTVAKPSTISFRAPRVELLEDRSTPALLNPAQALTPASPNTAFGAPARVVTGDFNGDGRTDFAGGQGLGGHVDVFTSSGPSGNAYVGQAIALGDQLNGAGSVTGPAFAAVDVTGNGRDELVIGGFLGDIYIAKSTFGGGFILGPSFTVDNGNTNVQGIVGGDFNKDGAQDLFVGLRGANEYVVLLNKGAGTFNETKSTARAGSIGSITPELSHPVTADFDGDGNLDVAVNDENFGGPRTVVFFGNGTGGFGKALNLPLAKGVNTAGLTVGDYNGDGKQDVAVALTNGSVTLHLNTGPRTFGTQNDVVQVSTAAGEITTADFNQDGFDDIAVTSIDNKQAQIRIFLGDATAPLVNEELDSPYFAVGPANGIVAGDFDRNGNPDLVAGVVVNTSNHQYQLFFNTLPIGGEVSIAQDVAITEFGQPVTFTATVTASKTATPTGTFTFFDGTTALATVPIDASLTATFTTIDLAVGKHSVFALYSGDANFPQVTTANVPVTVFQATTQTNATASSTSAAFGEAITVSIDVSALTGGVPTGQIAIFDNGNQIGFGTLDAAGNSTFITSQLELGPHTLLILYPGSTNFTASQAQTIDITINPSDSTTGLVADPVSVTFGDPINLNAFVNIQAPGTGSPSGSVNFFTNGTLLGSADLALGKALLSVSSLPVGNYQVLAKYLGNGAVGASSSGLVGISVAPTTSSTSLSITPSVTRVGDSVTLSAAVADKAGRPVSVGTVTFSGTQNGLPVSFTVNGVTPVNGVASTTVTGLAIGTADFTASFSGTPSITTSNAAPLTATINRALAASAITNSAGNTSTAALGKDVTFTTFFAPPTGLTTPVTGTVIFRDNGAPLQTVQIVNGVAALTARLTLGSHTITADFSGNASYAPSTTSSTVSIFRPAEPFLIGPGDGGSDIVRAFNADGSVQTDPLFAFGPDYSSGVRVALGDVNGDGVPDRILGTGPGTQARVRILDGATNAPIYDDFPFADFTGGVFVSVGDVNGDFRPDIVISPDQGGGPRVRVINGASFTVFADFFGIDDVNFRGGARAAIGDLNGDGFGDLIVSAGFGGGPRIAGFDGTSLGNGNTPRKLFADFFAFENTLRNGAYVAAGDTNNDGFAEIVLGAGPGGGPRVLAISGFELVNSGGLTQVIRANFFAGDINSRSGVPVATRFLNSDGFIDIVTGSGPGSRTVATYLGDTLRPNDQPPVNLTFEAFDEFTSALGGVFVG